MNRISLLLAAASSEKPRKERKERDILDNPERSDKSKRLKKDKLKNVEHSDNAVRVQDLKTPKASRDPSKKQLEISRLEEIPETVAALSTTDVMLRSNLTASIPFIGKARESGVRAKKARALDTAASAGPAGSLASASAFSDLSIDPRRTTHSFRVPMVPSAQSSKPWKLAAKQHAAVRKNPVAAVPPLSRFGPSSQFAITHGPPVDPRPPSVPSAAPTIIATTVSSFNNLLDANEPHPPSAPALSARNPLDLPSTSEPHLGSPPADPSVLSSRVPVRSAPMVPAPAPAPPAVVPLPVPIPVAGPPMLPVPPLHTTATIPTVGPVSETSPVPKFALAAVPIITPTPTITVPTIAPAPGPVHVSAAPTATPATALAAALAAVPKRSLMPGAVRGHSSAFPMSPAMSLAIPAEVPAGSPAEAVAGSRARLGPLTPATAPAPAGSPARDLLTEPLADTPADASADDASADDASADTPPTPAGASSAAPPAPALPAPPSPSDQSKITSPEGPREGLREGPGEGPREGPPRRAFVIPKVGAVPPRTLSPPKRFIVPRVQST